MGQRREMRIESLMVGPVVQPAVCRQGVACSGKRAVIKVAKAERNGTALGDTISVQSSGEALTEGVTQHSWAHGHDISEKLHEARVAIKGDAPAELAAST